MNVLWVLQAVLAAALLVTPRGSASASALENTIELRAFVHAAIEPATLELAKTTVVELLESARIRVKWRQCRANDPACRSEDAPHAVVLRLVSTRLSDTDRCGGASPGAMDGEIIMIFLSCHEDLIRTVRAKPVARSEPWLATLEIGHLLGLTMAHEIGHVLGLVHAPVGVMQARFDMDDFFALQTSRLAFMPHERLRIREAMLARTSPGVAEARRTAGGRSLSRP